MERIHLNNKQGRFNEIVTNSNAIVSRWFAVGFNRIVSRVPCSVPILPFAYQQYNKYGFDGFDSTLLRIEEELLVYVNVFFYRHFLISSFKCFLKNSLCVQIFNEKVNRRHQSKS